jgi:hypothetical protein
LTLSLAAAKASKAGYSLLGKKRRKVARIMDCPEELNEKIQQVEADEMKHSVCLD